MSSQQLLYVSLGGFPENVQDTIRRGWRACIISHASSLQNVWVLATDEKIGFSGKSDAFFGFISAVACCTGEIIPQRLRFQDWETEIIGMDGLVPIEMYDPMRC